MGTIHFYAEPVLVTIVTGSFDRSGSSLWIQEPPVDGRQI